MECYMTDECILLTGVYPINSEIPHELCRECNNDAKKFELEIEKSKAEREWEEYKNRDFLIFILKIYGFFFILFLIILLAKIFSN